MEKKFDQLKYQSEYNKKNYEVLGLNLKKGEKELFRKQAQKRGYKENEVSKYIRDLVYKDIENIGGVLSRIAA